MFHLAGLTNVLKSWDKPVEFYEANALGTVRVLDQCRDAGVAMTYLSAYVYGTPTELPIAENHPLSPNNPYAFSKATAESACLFYTQHCDVECVILRLFNVYGPGQDPSFLVPHVVAQVLDPHCGVVEVQDLAPERDYVFVEDAVQAIVAAGTAPSGSIFNVGSGEARSVEQVILAALAAANVKKVYRSVGMRRRNEIDQVVADISAIRSAVGWVPTYSLEAGLRRLVYELRAQ